MTAPAFSNHLREVVALAHEALEVSRAQGQGFDGIVFASGRLEYYHDDDMPVGFRSYPGFFRYAPVTGPGHHLLVQPGETPQLFYYAPDDYWHEPPTRPEEEIWEEFSVTEFRDPVELESLLPRGTFAHFGPQAELARELGYTHEPVLLKTALFWTRAYKTDYEVAQLRRAVERTAAGFARVEAGFQESRSARELFYEFLAGAQGLPEELLYGPIIAYDEAAAILHAQSKPASQPSPGSVLLVDAGISHRGYSADVTRTYLGPGVHSAFAEIHARLTALQTELVAMVQPGASYLDLHRHAERGVVEIARSIKLCRSEGDEAVAKGLGRVLLPHGLGHHLGLQVHDVGAKLASIRGPIAPPPPEYPWLRTTRALEPRQVVTVEPGFYLIPSLLEPWHRDHPGSLNPELVESLYPHGGIRIEDDLLVTAGGHENLTHAIPK